MAEKKEKKKSSLKSHFLGFPKALMKQMLALSTSGFGLVAALAWNEVIKEVVEKYIRPFFGGNSGIVSLLIYAIAITMLAVFVTYNLSLVVKKDEN